MYSKTTLPFPIYTFRPTITGFFFRHRLEAQRGIEPPLQVVFESKSWVFGRSPWVFEDFPWVFEGFPRVFAEFWFYLQFFMRKVVLLITEMLCLAQNGLHSGGFGPSEAFFSLTIFAKVNFFSENASVSLSFRPKIAWVFSDLEFFSAWAFSKTSKKKPVLNVTRNLENKDLFLEISCTSSHQGLRTATTSPCHREFLVLVPSLIPGTLKLDSIMSLIKLYIREVSNLPGSWWRRCPDSVDY